MRQRRTWTELDEIKNGALAEMVEYIEDKPGISYYDLKAYAYDNDKDNWIAALKDSTSRNNISTILKDKRREEGIPYRTPERVAMRKAFEAESAYNERHGIMPW